MANTIEIGVIGGSGLYNMPEVTDVSRQEIDTPFGKPSGDIIVGTLRGKRIAFVPRHGEGHIYSPEYLPHRANIFALKQLGVRFIVAVNACGSMREDYAPGHIVVPDQIFDYTIGKRERSFFKHGIVAHVSVANPMCHHLRELIVKAVADEGGTVHGKGMILVEDGPRFATKGESNVFRGWGADIVGMTNAPEAFLAREAEIAYASMAHITDYDVWHDEPVTAGQVMATFGKNIDLAQRALARTIELLDPTIDCEECHYALTDAIMTAPDRMSTDMIESLRPLVKRVLNLSD